MKTSIKNHLDLLALCEGASHRGPCPVCNRPNTFSATKQDGVVLYQCYSLSCTVKGANYQGMTASEILFKIRQQDTHQQDQDAETMVWPEYVVQPSAEHNLMKRYVTRWGLEHDGLLYDVKDKRAVFPITHKGRVIDAIGRSLDGAVPKWYRYTGAASVYKSVVGKPSGVVVIVEDVISAIVAAKQVPGMTGLAILGTSINGNTMKHIDGYYKVLVALDPDASYKTLQYKKEIQSWTGLETIAMRLDDDIKYKLPSDMEKLERLS